MIQSPTPRAFPAAFFAAAVLVFASCGSPETIETNDSAVVTSGQLDAVAAPDLSEAVAVFVSGTVENQAGATGAGAWRQLRVGDRVAEDSAVRVGRGGRAELQLGDRSIVALDENTEIRLSMLRITDDSSRVEIGLRSGSVSSKVSSLAGSDSYRVRTSTGVAGVRGTVFSVSTDEEGQTRVAVTEGRVAILPSGEQLDRTLGAVQDPEVQEAVLRALEDSSETVEPGQELEFGVWEVEQSAAVYEDLAASMAAIVAAPEESRRNRTRELAGSRLRDNFERPRGISADAAGRLSDLETKQFVPVDRRGGRGRGEAATSEVPESAQSVFLLPLEISAEQSAATIFLDGVRRGSGSVSALFASGQTVAIRVSLPGYRTYEQQIALTGEAGLALKISLIEVQQTPAVTAEDAQAVRPAAPIDRGPVEVTEADFAALAANEDLRGADSAPVRLKIITIPNATIFVNGNRLATGQTEIDSEKGARLAILVTAPGYVSREIEHVLGFAPSQELSIRLESSSQGGGQAAGQTDGQAAGQAGPADGGAVSLSRTGLSSLGVLPGGGVVTVDGSGTVNAVDGTGRIAWTLATQLQGVGQPVVSGTRVYLLGDSLLVVVDAATGRLLLEQRLTAQNGGRGGRYPAVIGSSLILPTDTGFEVRNSANGRLTRTVTLSGRFDSSPAAFGDEVLILSSTGTLMLVNPSSSAVVAQVETGLNQPTAAAPVLHGSTVYLAAASGQVAAVGTATWSLLWRVQVPQQRPAPTVLAAGDWGVAAYHSGDGTLVGLSAARGAVMFNKSAASGPALALGSTLAFPSRDGTLQVVSALTGDTAATRSTGASSSLQARLSAGKIFVATSRGEVVVLNAEGLAQ